MELVYVPPPMSLDYSQNENVPRSLYYYHNLEVVVPTWLLALIGFSSVILSIFACVKGWDRCTEKIPCVQDLIIRVNKFLLIELEIKQTKQKNGEQEKRYRYYLYGVQVRYVVILYLFVLFMTIISMSFVIFWDTFAVEEIHGCDSAYDCFPFPANYDNIPFDSTLDCTLDAENKNVSDICNELFLGSINNPYKYFDSTRPEMENCTHYNDNENISIACYRSWKYFDSTQRIENCSYYIDNENISVSCFRLVLKYSEGLGDAGGFLFGMQVLVNTLVYITVRLRKVKCCSKSICAGILIFFAWIGQVGLMIALPAGLVDQQKEVKETLLTGQRKLQVATYMIMNIILLLIIPVVVFGSLCLNDKQLANEPEDGIENETTGQREASNDYEHLT